MNGEYIVKIIGEGEGEYTTAKESY